MHWPTLVNYWGRGGMREERNVVGWGESCAARPFTLYSCLVRDLKDFKYVNDISLWSWHMFFYLLDTPGPHSFLFKSFYLFLNRCFLKPLTKLVSVCLKILPLMWMNAGPTVCRYVCGLGDGVSKCVCMWCADHRTLRCHSFSDTIHVVFWDRVSHWLGNCQAYGASWSASPRESVSLCCPDTGVTSICHHVLFPFSVGLEIKLRFSCLQGKVLSRWASL